MGGRGVGAELVGHEDDHRNDQSELANGPVLHLQEPCRTHATPDVRPRGRWEHIVAQVWRLFAPSAP